MSSPTTTPTTVAMTGWDRFGIGVSAVCVVHCFLTPLLFALPLIGSVHSAHDAHGELVFWLHPLFATVVTPVAVIAMLRTGPDVGRRWRRQGLLGAGLGLVLVALLCGAIGQPTAESFLTLGGSVLLVGGHRWRSGCPAPGTCGREG